jgi:PIN domain nuclease of toxin-antitoxin system
LRLLLDSVAVLRVATDPRSLGGGALAAIEDLSNELILSAASVWEIAVKAAAGRLDLGGPADRWFERQRRDLFLTFHPMSVDDALRAAALPRHHADPFDRMLVAQAQSLRASIVTNDVAIQRYDVDVVW